MKIRPAVEADLAQLIPLFQGQVTYQQQIHPCLHHVSGIDWVHFVRAKVKDPDGRVFVAEQDERLMGYIHVRVTSPLPSRLLRDLFRRFLGRHIAPPSARASRVGWVDDCYIEPATRRHGSGSALVQAGLAWLKVQQVGRVELAVYVANSGGQAFWERQGFSPYQVLMSRETDRATLGGSIERPRSG